jgi:peptide chain release factor 3
VQCVFDPVPLSTARWVESADARKMEEFRGRMHQHLALDHSGALVYLAPSRVNLELTLERWPDITFRETREHAS